MPYCPVSDDFHLPLPVPLSSYMPPAGMHAGIHVLFLPVHGAAMSVVRLALHSLLQLARGHQLVYFRSHQCLKYERCSDTPTRCNAHVQGLTLVFVETKAWADRLERFLVQNKFPATTIHGDLSQDEREYVSLSHTPTCFHQ